MLEPFSTLHEHRFSAVGGGVVNAAEAWTADLILQLDWLRLAELVRALVADAGCELAGSRVGLDGSVVFGMVEGPRSERPQRVLVKTVAWDEWGASVESVDRFAREVATARDTRGVLVAPAGFSTAALHAAREHRIETVDAHLLNTLLAKIAPERSEFFFVIATAGDFRSPSCPVCMKKLTQRQVEVQAPVELQEELLILQDAIVAEPVFCRTLRIARNSDVQFLSQVRAHEVLIEGTVSGDVLCDGTVRLAPTAVLNGSVAARAMQVEEGAQLLAKTRILVGKLEPLVRRDRVWQWRCSSGSGQPSCQRVLFEPHL